MLFAYSLQKNKLQKLQTEVFGGTFPGLFLGRIKPEFIFVIFYKLNKQNKILKCKSYIC